LTKVAVIGAGLSGLVAERELGDCSEVTVFVKVLGLMTAFESPHLTLLLTSRLNRSFAPSAQPALAALLA
jgi:predicted NAD/FAD-dependent oxidoreductase